MRRRPVPAGWLAALLHLDAAEAALRVMSDPGASPKARAAAEATYRRAADGIVAELGLLRRQGVLDGVGAALRDAEGS